MELTDGDRGWSGVPRAPMIEDSKDDVETQKHIRQTEKLAAIGQLVAGVAHEINNPLTGVLGLLDLLRQSQTDPQALKDIEAIRHETTRCVKIVGDMLRFARASVSQRVHTDLNSIIDKALDIARMTSGARHDIEIVRESADLPSLWVDPDQMEQVFLNLIANAFQAMLDHQRSGRLIIRCGSDGGTVHVRFIDNGPGIAPEDLPKIFDPFFTTKEVGKGTGLGLSVSYGIVQEHGGRILVESGPGRGAAFTVELPLRTQSWRVLVVDDDEAVREACEEEFEGDWRFEFRKAESAFAAGKIAADFKPHVMVLDIRLGDRDGREFCREIRSDTELAACKIIGMSGYLTDLEERKLLDAGFDAFVRKPFRDKTPRAVALELLGWNAPVGVKF